MYGIDLSRDRTKLQQTQMNKVLTELKVRQKSGEINLSLKYVRGVPTIQSSISQQKNA